jgi:hypothetical protein
MLSQRGDDEMQTVQRNVRGLNLVFKLNLDRMIYIGAIFVSLGVAAQVASVAG